MPRFPTYERQVGLSGGSTASYASDSAFGAPARALAGVGDALADVGSDFAQVEQKVRETQDNTWFSKARAQTAVDMIGKERELQTGATDGAKDYTPKVRGTFDEYRKAKIAEAPSKRAASMFQEWSDGYDVDLTRRSATFQAESELAKRTSDFADTMNAHAQAILADPSQYDAVTKRAMDDFEGAKQWMTPEQETEARAKVDHDLKLARAKSLVEFKPEDFIKEVGKTTRVSAAKMAPDVQGRASQAMGFFTSKGYTKEQAAGIVGNLIGESKLNTGARNPGDGSDGTDSIGIGQWNSDRATRLKAFAAQNHADWRDFGIQLAFVDHELRTTESAAGNRLKSARNVDEATAAFVGYERPQGWSEANPRGAHNYKGRLSHAVAAAGGDVAEFHEGGDFSKDPRYEGLSVDEILSLQNSAQTTINANQATAYNQMKDSIALGIQTGTIMSENDILGSGLNDGDKASAISRFREVNKDSIAVRDVLEGLANNSLSLDPFDSDARKAVDKTAELVKKRTAPEDYQRHAEEIVRQSGIVPKDIVNEIRKGLQSTNAQDVANAANMASRISQIDPAALGRRDGGKEAQDAATAYQHYTDTVGLSPEDAAKRLIDQKDPEKVKARASLMESKPIKDFIKDQATESRVRDIFDPGVFGFDPQLGETPAQAAGMVGEYSDILEESVFDANGDTELGTILAAERFQKKYGVSDFLLAGTGIVTRLPPEKTYPAGLDGTHDYIRQQAIEALAAEGITTDQVFLQSDTLTEQDVEAGRPAHYQIFYRNGDNIERYMLPFFAVPPSGAELRENAISQATERMKQNRADRLRGQDREGNLNRSLDGNPLTGEFYGIRH